MTTTLYSSRRRRRWGKASIAIMCLAFGALFVAAARTDPLPRQRLDGTVEEPVDNDATLYGIGGTFLAIGSALAVWTVLTPEKTRSTRKLERSDPVAISYQFFQALQTRRMLTHEFAAVTDAEVYFSTKPIVNSHVLSRAAEAGHLGTLLEERAAPGFSARIDSIPLDSLRAIATADHSLCRLIMVDGVRDERFANRAPEIAAYIAGTVFGDFDTSMVAGTALDVRSKEQTADWTVLHPPGAGPDINLFF